MGHWRSALSVRMPECQKLKMACYRPVWQSVTNWGVGRQRDTALHTRSFVECCCWGHTPVYLLWGLTRRGNVGHSLRCCASNCACVVIITNDAFFLSSFCCFFFFLLIPFFPPTFSLASPAWKQARSTWNFNTACWVVWARGRLLFGTVSPRLQRRHWSFFRS